MRFVEAHVGLSDLARHRPSIGVLERVNFRRTDEREGGSRVRIAATRLSGKPIRARNAHKEASGVSILVQEKDAAEFVGPELDERILLAPHRPRMRGRRIDFDLVKDDMARMRRKEE